MSIRGREIVDIIAMESLSYISVLDTLRRSGCDCSGASKLESSLIIALVSIAVVAGASDLGALLHIIYNDTAETIQQSAKDCGPGNGNGNCGNSGNGGGNTGGSGPGTGNGGRGTGSAGGRS